MCTIGGSYRHFRKFLSNIGVPRDVKHWNVPVDLNIIIFAIANYLLRKSKITVERLQGQISLETLK